MNLKLKNLQGKNLGEFEVPSSFLDHEVNSAVVRQAVLAEMVNLRQGTHSSKNRSAVRGGGKKPWKQKGRGAARAGTIRSPLWKGGGVVFGPNPHGYKHKLPKSMSLSARKSLIIDKIKNDKLIVVENFILESGKTSSLSSSFNLLGLEGKKITLLVSSLNENLNRAVNNLSNVYLINVKYASVYELIDCEYVLIDQDSLNIFIEMLMK
jgi:large subunit ribosomal protein L4